MTEPIDRNDDQDHDDQAKPLGGDVPNGATGEPRPEHVAQESIALGLVDRPELYVSKGAIGAARADRVFVEMGAVGAVAAREARVSMAGVGAVAGQDVRVEQSFVRSIMAGRVHLGRGAVVGIVFAGRAEGEGRPLLDWRGGLALGLAAGVFWLVGRRLR